MARRVLMATVAAAALAVAGCASIPDTGTVHTADSTTDKAVDSLYTPPGPQPGASPEELIGQFLDAMRAKPVTSEVAREFLTEKAADSWDPDQETIVYNSETQQEMSGDRVELVLDTYASLGRRGGFTPTFGDDRALDLKFEKEDGQWRIADPPDAYLLDESQFEGNYLPLSLYFINDSHRSAVPDPVYLPEGDQLATSAIDGLLQGPSDALGEAATTFIPQDTELEVSVRVGDGGIAEVRLAGDLEDLDADSRKLMSAQIVLTLRQVPGVEGVRILVDDVPYEVSGVDEVQPTNAWDQYDPSVSSEPSDLFAMHNGRLVVIQDDEVHEFAGPWEGTRADIDDFAVNGDEDRIAVVEEGRTTASVGSLAINAADRKTVLVGDHLLAPRWDPLDWLWLVDARKESTSIAVWHEGGELRSIPIGELDGMRVTSISISPDGTRFAAIALPPGAKDGRDAAAYVGYIRRSSKDNRPVEVEGVHRVRLDSSNLKNLRSVAWRDATHLVLLADRGALSRQPYVVAIDGSSISGGVSVDQPSLPEVGAVSVAASGRISDPIYVADDDGGVWKLDSTQRWSKISDEKIWTPHYAG
ncbi:LpqB family beta-propeller domain-containing protein [Solicola gregarius]|uniref:LpqB family beta-propeller domain-containing protein n=1 Tax=Solicola gregarius TaxID=2908642 RepID=A0AA46YK14_9ACTN|nr:LpqB family beta-propeller domain-containing protein [Solicola gregarius]UYM04046.1 LpqB family beta-propeller domain-containing protein [Solicola gregarius]